MEVDMNWNTLLSDKRKGSTRSKQSDDLRTEFQRDYHRIIGSASFRRLQDKTQVFPLDKSDFVRTRLTHSLEVSSIAKSLGQSCCTYLMSNNIDPDVDESVRDAVCSILECAGLLHDIGNPPFGHFGETAIRDWFEENLDKIAPGKKLDEQMRGDLLNFEGNAQALRLLTKLHYLVDENGMHLTYALLNTIIKYPVSSTAINKKSGNIKDKKMGYYYAESDLFEDITTSTGAFGNRYPLTYLLEAADDIAYKTADIEDAVKKGLITLDALVSDLNSPRYMDNCRNDEEKSEYIALIERLETLHDRALSRGVSNPEVNAVQNWIISLQTYLLRNATKGFCDNYGAIMSGEFTTDVLTASSAYPISEALGKIAYERAFLSAPIIRLEIAAGTMLNFLLDSFVYAAVDYDTGKKLSSIDEKLISIISDNYIQNYKFHARDKSESEKLYLRLLLVTDFICGMTDSYAKSLYQELSGII